MSVAGSSSSDSTWTRLSPSCQAAMAWALSLDPRERGTVFSENLLLGLIHVHPSANEPELLLSMYGQGSDALEEQVRRISAHHQASGDPALVLSDMPRLSSNTLAALGEAISLTEREKDADGFVHVPHLFGGLLTQKQSYAYRALQATIGADANLEVEAKRYLGEFLPNWRSSSYADFLRRSAGEVDTPPQQRPAPRDRVEWVDDAPTTKDLLDREAIAGVIADRLGRMDIGDDRVQKTFLVHIDGPWGSGKSTLLEFLRGNLARDRWLVVSFDAWRQSRVGIPWWSLLMALRHALGRDGGFWHRASLRVRESGQRALRGGAPYVASVILVLLAAAAIFFLLQPSQLSLSNMGEMAKSVGAIIATLATLTAGALAVSRFLMWDSPVGARLYEQSQKNPMEGLAEHFGWLTEQAGRPVVFFIDDLDRCDEKYVVDLLDSIQTLIRDSPRIRREKAEGRGHRKRLSPTYFVVAADGAWLRQSYEMGYSSFATAVAQPGRSLGYLFLDKIFQLTVPVPLIQAATQTAYIQDLLQLQEGEASGVEAKVAQLAQAVAKSSTRQEAVDAMMQAPDAAVRRLVAPRLVEKVNEAALSKSTEHELTKFATLLEPNPRAMKRFLNTFAMADSVLFLQDVFVSQDELALWTILRLRWPLLGDYLRARPDAIGSVAKRSAAPAGVPAELVPLFGAEEVCTIVEHPEGGPLTADKIRKCSGISVDDRVMDASAVPLVSMNAGSRASASASVDGNHGGPGATDSARR
jgi:hypothetical protein